MASFWSWLHSKKWGRGVRRGKDITVLFFVLSSEWGSTVSLRFHCLIPGGSKIFLNSTANGWLGESKERVALNVGFKSFNPHQYQSNYCKEDFLITTSNIYHCLLQPQIINPWNFPSYLAAVSTPVITYGDPELTSSPHSLD